LTKSHKTQPPETKPPAGGVRHDARGNAVWQWATETARHAVASTSQLLRRLDVSSLSLEDDAQPPNALTKPAPTGRAASGKPALPARNLQAGFNPYDGGAPPRVAAGGKKPAAPPAPPRRSWWRRLLQRR
jgi:hypothetical protein